MFLMNPDEQRQLLAASAAVPATAGSAPAPTAQNHASAKRRKTGFHHGRPAARAAIGRSAARFIRGFSD
jgi:4'-phosphopantetheinyl transferase EntD